MAAIDVAAGMGMLSAGTVTGVSVAAIVALALKCLVGRIGAMWRSRWPRSASVMALTSTWVWLSGMRGYVPYREGDRDSDG